MKNFLAHLGILIAFFSLSSGTSSALTSEEILTAYKRLRIVPLDSTRVVSIENLVIKKDRAEFHLKEGIFYFQKPVLDRVRGGIFIGEGAFSLKPASKIEKEHIDRLNKGKELEESFKELYLLFTDQTYAEVMQNSSVHTEKIDSKAVKILDGLREDLRKRFRWNISAKMIADLSSERPSGYFVAFIKSVNGRKFVFEIDPKNREEVSLSRYKHERFAKVMSIESWYSSDTEDAEGEFLDEVDTKTVTLDISIDKKRKINGIAKIEFTPLVGGESMLRMNLAPTLRVESVRIGEETGCLFIQEDEEEDADFWILFPEPLTNGETNLLTIKYTGKDVIEDVGGGNYHVGRRTSWYPNFGLFRDRSFYKVIYSVPKKLTLISTGTLTKKWEDSDVSYSEWESEIPFTVFGFNYGRFENVTEKGTLIEITCYTNPGLHYRLQELRFSLEKSSELREELMMFPSELTTSKMTQNAVTQGMNVYIFFTHYFGEIPFKKISITQQPVGGYAQSWPTLIYLPYTAFLTPSVRDRLGFHSDYEILSYHEIAHQWWGHIVGFETYHDRWLDEGLAEYSAALYLQHSEGDKIFIKYMDILRKRILKKVKGGIRWTDVGPIWMGMRLRTIDNPENDYLIYSKGAYVFHMLRMMLYDFQNQSDEKFINMVKDYLNTHFNKNASTISFQAIVEKHFGQDMDWFFDQWVYGTEVPTYKFTHTVQPTEDGKYLLALKVTQEGVSPSFKMPLPFLINFENGYSIVTVPVEGRDIVKHEIKIPSKPKSIKANPWNAVLAEIK